MNLEPMRRLPDLNGKSSLNSIDSKEKNRSRSGKLSKKLPDSNLKKEWKWKGLREKRELNKSD